MKQCNKTKPVIPTLQLKYNISNSMDISYASLLVSSLQKTLQTYSVLLIILLINFSNLRIWRVSIQTVTSSITNDIIVSF